MNDLERELQRALSRKDAPAGFAERVLARVAPPRRRSWTLWIPAAVAACVLLAAGVVHQREVDQGEEAKRQLLTALEITAKTIQFAESKVQRLDALEQRP